MRTENWKGQCLPFWVHSIYEDLYPSIEDASCYSSSPLWFSHQLAYLYFSQFKLCSKWKGELKYAAEFACSQQWQRTLPLQTNYANCRNVADLTVAMSLLLLCLKYYIILYFRELVGMKNSDIETEEPSYFSIMQGLRWNSLYIKILTHLLWNIFILLMRCLSLTSVSTKAKCNSMVWQGNLYWV